MNSTIQAEMEILLRPNYHQSWSEDLAKAAQTLDSEYLAQLMLDDKWLPGCKNLFNAFQLPKSQVRFILFGETPYPRTESANGFAFWDNAVEEIWSSTGFSKPVNRATSLRNWLKMLLVANGALSIEDTSQNAIMALDKSAYVQTLDQFFQNLLEHGVLLLNASLVLSTRNKNYDAKAWLPFMNSILNALRNKNVRLILFGKIAQAIIKLQASRDFDIFQAEHPYNISFISNPEVLQFFKPMQLLNRRAANV